MALDVGPIVDGVPVAPGAPGPAGGSSPEGGSPPAVGPPLRRWARVPVPSVVGWAIVATLAGSGLRAEDRADLVAVSCGVFLAGLGVVVATGWARQANLGQLGFVGVGAYAAAWLDGWPWLLRLVGGGVAAALVAVPVGLAASHVRGLTLGALTLLAGVTIWSLGRTPSVMSHVGGSSSTGVILRQPPWADDDGRFAVVALAIAGACLAAVLGFRRSRTGRAMAGLADAQPALVADGWDPRRLVLLAFMVSAALGGMAGVLLGTAYGSLSAADIDPYRSLLLFAQIAVFGAACTAAPALAAAVLAVFTLWDLPPAWLGIASGLGLVGAGATLPRGYLDPATWRRR